VYFSPSLVVIFPFRALFASMLGNRYIICRSNSVRTIKYAAKPNEGG
jgi:hypothetical protein